MKLAQKPRQNSIIVVHYQASYYEKIHTHKYPNKRNDSSISHNILKLFILVVLHIYLSESLEDGILSTTQYYLVFPHYIRIKYMTSHDDSVFEG